MKRKVFLLCLILMLFLCSCGKAEENEVVYVIDFNDYTAAEALAWANERGVAQSFRFVYVFDAQTDSGKVIAQSVECGSPITEDGIELTVAAKVLLSDSSSANLGILVPNVIGTSYSEAKAQLEALGLQVDSKYQSSEKPKDTVLLSDPLPCSIAAENSKVLLTLSSGERRGSSLLVSLDIPSTGQENNTIMAYVDDELDRSKTVCLSASVRQKTFRFNGTGIQTVKFNLNGEFLTEYTLDFDKETVKKTK